MYIDLSKITSGFSDRLRVLTFFIAIKLKNSSNFEIFEKKTKQCPFRFIDLCNIKKMKIKKLENKIKFKRNIIFTPYNSEINLKNCMKAIRSYNLIKCIKLLNRWKESYSSILPKPILLNKIKKIKLPSKYIGIHIRSTDRVIKLHKILYDIQLKDMIFTFQLKNFEKNIIKYIKKYSNLKSVYIASDQEKLKIDIAKKLNKHRYKVFYNNCNFNKKLYRKTSGEDFLVDLFCLSKSQLILSTVGGGVPYSAYLISNKKIQFRKWINEMNIYIFLRVLVLFIFYLKKLKKFFFFSK